MEPICLAAPRRSFTAVAFLTIFLFLSVISTKAFALNIEVKTFTLKNGLQVVVIPDHRAPARAGNGLCGPDQE